MSDAAKIQRREHSEGRRITVCVTLFTVCVFAQNLPGCAFFIGDIGNILAYLSMGDRIQDLERLVSALAEIRRRYQKDPNGMLTQEYVEPVVVTSPQEAFYAEKVSLPLEQCEGRVCSEFVMCYPPGIPLLAPGEQITKTVLEHIQYAKEKGCSMTGSEDPELKHLNVLA